jgi:hypothetical protein
VRLAIEGRGLGILDTEGLSVKVMVVAGLAAGGATGFFGAVFLTTTLRLSVSFLVSRASSEPKSRPSRKSSSSTTGLGCDPGRDPGCDPDRDSGQSSRSRGGVDVCTGEGGDVNSTEGASGGAEVGDSWYRGWDGIGEASGVRYSAAFNRCRRAVKLSGSCGRTRPPRSSSSLSTVMQLPMLGLMAETEELRAPRASLLVPPKRMPKLPSPQSSKSSRSSVVGELGAGSFSFSFNAPSMALVGSSRSLHQSSSTAILRFDFFFPSRLMEPPSRADDGTLLGMGMPACFAEMMALSVESSSFGVRRTCQSSSAVLDSERTETRDEVVDWMVDIECAKRSPWASKSASSSQFSIDGAMEAMRWAKLPLLAMAEVRAAICGVVWLVYAGAMGCEYRCVEVELQERRLGASGRPPRRPCADFWREQEAVYAGQHTHTTATRQ